MGYFRRPIDRARCLAEAASLAEQPLPEIRWEKIPRRPPTKSAFVRFSTLIKDEESGRRAGILTFSHGVLRRGDLHPSTADGLQVARDWFCENLPGPNVFEARAIWFFKTDAKTCMARAWELIHWLEEAGVLVEMQTLAGNAGRIVYEDQYQAAIVPHADSGVV